MGYNVGDSGVKWGKMVKEHMFYTLKWGNMTHYP